MTRTCLRNNIERKYIHQHFVYTLKHELKKMYYMDNEQRDLSCGENQNIETNKEVFMHIFFLHYKEVHQIYVVYRIQTTKLMNQLA